MEDYKNLSSWCWLKILGSWVWAHWNNTRWIDSACHPSEVGKMRTSLLVTGALHQWHSHVSRKWCNQQPQAAYETTTTTTTGMAIHQCVCHPSDGCWTVAFAKEAASDRRHPGKVTNSCSNLQGALYQQHSKLCLPRPCATYERRRRGIKTAKSLFNVKTNLYPKYNLFSFRNKLKPY